MAAAVDNQHNAPDRRWCPWPCYPTDRVGLKRFGVHFNAAPVATMLSYWVGQWAIAASAFKRINKTPVTATHNLPR
ncbi:hypothetical protein [uncultured Pseudomonas sp.]|uniref:hypothetical protein n=1 Tax=uncultured Pseudomonas sp. TaxID=114707 RepID=UPI002610ED42|nr:hypothetical protein [uncultured Pseudomonas sp.]